MIKGKIKQDWRDLDGTPEQYKAIVNMLNCLNSSETIPRKRGERADMIEKLIKRVEKRISSSCQHYSWMNDYDKYPYSDPDWIRDTNSIFDM